uniref:Putative lipocalin-8 1 n=1 Tax=Amblyomma triste TaxID=251400 RepID=A0A023GD72_AMBTT
MFFATCVGFMAVCHFAASSTQNPTVTPCPGMDDPAFEIKSVTIKDAALGQKVKITATIVVNEVVGVSPVLKISFSKSDGTKLPCESSVLPCEFKTCDGTTRTERILNADWDNKCPVQPGTYTSHLSFRLPKSQTAKEYIGDGHLTVTLNVVDNGEVLDCVCFPMTIEV